MPLPTFSNVIVGTRLLDAYATPSTSNEIINFGSSASNGVGIRLYDNNNPSIGGLIQYNSGLNTLAFFGDSNNLISLGINTSNVGANVNVIGGGTITGTLTTTNLVVGGLSSISKIINVDNNTTVTLYQPSGKDSTNTLYKNITTNDSIYTNRILFYTILTNDNYLLSANISYLNLDPIRTLGDTRISIGVYNTTPGSFDPTQQIPLQNQLIDIGNSTSQHSINLNFYFPVLSTNKNILIAVSGIGETIRFGGNQYPCFANYISVSTIGTSHTYTIRRPLVSGAIRQTFVVNQATSTFVLSTKGIYQLTDPLNVEIYVNGLKLAYSSSTQRDYTIQYSNTTTNTTFTITTTTTISINSIVDIVIWPELNYSSTSNNAYSPAYLYQSTYNWVGSQYLNVSSNSGFVGIGTLNPVQQLTINGNAIFSSNIGIGTIPSNGLLQLYNTTERPLMTSSQTLLNQEYPPVDIKNVYFAPDNNDTITSIDFSPSLSNLEYPPAAMTDYATLLASTYGAGTYTASASSEYDSTNYLAWKAFTKLNVNTYNWISYNGSYSVGGTGSYEGTKTTVDTNGNVYSGEWLQIQLPFAIQLNSYQLSAYTTTASQNPKNWYILASSDGISWTLINTQTNISWATTTIRNFGVQTTNNYTYYRMVISLTDSPTTASPTPYVVVNQWRLFTNVSIPRNIYPKYKATLSYYTPTTTYGSGQYQIWTNTIFNYSFSNQLLPSGLFNKTTTTSSNTFWGSFSNRYTSTIDSPSQYVPIIYAQFPNTIQLSSYSLTASLNPSLTPSKWSLFGSNTSLTTNWTSLDTQSGQTSWTTYQKQTYTVNTTTAYDFYKLELYRNSTSTANYMFLGELQFYGTSTIPESRLVIANNGFVGFGTTNPQTPVDIKQDLNIKGILGEAILRTGPYVSFDGSTTNRDLFLKWMQYVTSTEYRFKFKRPELASSTWWNAGNSVTQYDNYTYSTIAGAYGYSGGVLLPDGRVVFVPYNATTIGIFNPNTNTYSTIAGAPGNYAYVGGVLLPDGRVVFVPYDATTIGIFNPITNIYSTIAGAPGNAAYSGGVLLPDGRVLFVPLNATTIGFFNPSTNTYSTIAGAPGNSAYAGGVLLPDGRVVFVPYNATTIGIFNPNTNTYSTIAGAPGGGAYYGGVLLPDGRVLFVPRATTYIGIFNSLTNTYSSIAGANGCSGGVLLPDGRVVFVPAVYTISSIGFFNPSTNTYSIIATGTLPGSLQYFGGVLVPDGRVLFVPSSIDTIGILTPTQLARPPPLELCYHPCFNKF
jgi:streptogramin lyase